MTIESRIAKLSLLTVTVLSATTEDSRTMAGTFRPSSAYESARSYVVDGYLDDAIENARDWWDETSIRRAIACTSCIDFSILSAH